MKKYLFFILSFTLWFCQSNKQQDNSKTGHDHAAETTKEQKPLSPVQMAMNNIGSNHVHIEYGAPGVRNRVIWGGLVPYDVVWATGAHMATTIQFGKDLIINQTRVPAGKYALFTIPGREKWTVIINKNWDQHLADEYSETEDILRFDITPEILDEIQEQLTFTVTPGENKKGSISLSWEKIRISFPVESVE